MSRTDVLVVDDEPGVLRAVRRLLAGGEDLAVETTTHPEEAIAILGERPPKVLLTDYQMPGGDGLELCTRLRSTPETAEIPALMLTARGYKVPQSDLDRTNIKALMSKPFSPRQLVAMIEEHLGEPPAGQGQCGEPGATAA